MSQAITRAVVGDYFEYSRLKKEFSKQEIDKFQSYLLRRYSAFTKNWSDELNSAWVVRNYLAVKMILSASIMLSSCEYAIDHNLRVVEPYLLYYALFNCLRTSIFTSPNVEWGEGVIVEMNHQKVINTSIDAISRFSRKYASNLEEFVMKARDYRELFSYKFPANGINDEVPSVGLLDVIHNCQLICEISQLQSEMLEISHRKNIKKTYQLDFATLKKGLIYEGKSYSMVDREDMYRLDYIQRKMSYPWSLYLTMTEGMVEDFFGAWCSKEDKSDTYDPDVNWQIIFPVP